MQGSTSLACGALHVTTRHWRPRLQPEVSSIGFFSGVELIFYAYLRCIMCKFASLTLDLQAVAATASRLAQWINKCRLVATPRPATWKLLVRRDWWTRQGYRDTCTGPLVADCNHLRSSRRIRFHNFDSGPDLGGACAKFSWDQSLHHCLTCFWSGSP